MGASCSEPVNANRNPQRRASFKTIRSTLTDTAQSLLKDGDALEETYAIGDQVGSDKLVRKATNNETEVEYVIRQIPKSDCPVTDVGDLEDHFRNLRALQHVHICRFMEAYNMSDSYELVYEMADAKTLFQEEKGVLKGKKLPEDTVREYTRQIAMALAVAHKHSIVHGRLSETSILFDPIEQEEGDVKQVKLCDIGQTFVMRQSRLEKRIEYTAPEVLWQEVESPSNTRKMRDNIKTYISTDMWALGVLVYTMLTGTPPFAAGKGGVSLTDQIKSSTVTFDDEVWEKMPDAKDAVRALLRHSGRLRISAERLLKHQWISRDKEKMSRSKMMRVMQNVIYNSSESTFKKFAMRVIAEDMSAEKFEVVQAAFRCCDVNGDGNLEVSEIKTVLHKFLEEHEGEASNIFEAIDRDASGSLNFAEFMAVSIGPHEYCDKETLWHTFNRFDKDQNGQFDKMEISGVVREVEHLAENSEVWQEVEEIAKDIEMPMDFDTFVHIMYTPTGKDISKGKRDLSRACWNIFRIDLHGVRKIEPKIYESQVIPTSPLLKSPYRRGSVLNASSASLSSKKGGRKSRSKSQVVEEDEEDE